MGMRNLKLFVLTTILFFVGLYGCNPYSMVALGIEAASLGYDLTKANKQKSSIAFAPEMDTEQTVRGVLDKTPESEAKSVMLLSDNKPKSKILFYYRGNKVHPILFTYDSDKGVFVYQAIWTWDKKEFGRKKDTPEYKKACEEWYSNELIKRANKHSNQNQFDVAYLYIKEIEEVRPISAEAYNGIAWFYATNPNPEYRNGEKALDYAQKIISKERTHQSLDTLAAAYAEVGDFEKAVEIETGAYNLADDNESKTLYAKLIEAYRNNKTYIEWKREK